jgi:HEAT repeat protein
MARFLMILFLTVSFFGCRGASREDLPRLRRELHDRDSRVRNQAALAIASLGGEGKDAVPELIRLLNDENGGVRTAAAFALHSIDDPSGVAAVERYKREHPLGAVSTSH